MITLYDLTFAEDRRRGAVVRRRGGELHRVGDDLHPRARGMRHLHDHLPGEHVRIGEDLVERVDRAAADLQRLQRLDPLGRRPALHHRRQRVGDELPVLDALRVGGEALVGEQVLQAEGLAEALEGRVVGDREDDVAVLRREFLVGRDVRVLVAEARRIQAALDAERATPQVYKIRASGQSGELLFEFFTPLPSWAERYLALVGLPVLRSKSSLFTYRLPAAAVEEVKAFLSTSLWMDAIEEGRRP